MKRFSLIFIITFIIANIFILKASANLGDGLVAYYPFNGNADDVSGNAHHGIVNGAILTTDRFGNPDSAYNFDGADDYIENNTFQDIATNITLTAWIKYESYLPDMYTRTIIAKADNNGVDAGFTLHLKETDNGIPRVRFIINDNDGGRSDVISGQIAINTWYFVVVSYDGVKQSFFLNGCLVNSKENSGIINPATSNLLIGRSDNTHYGGPAYFDGSIDEIRIYDRVLSENEIQQLYKGPITIRISEEATEGDGVLEDQGIVSIISAPDTDLVISLSSDDTSLITVPETVTMHADQNNATFDVTVLDNCINNGTQNITITASASGYISGSDDIQVADNDVSIEIELPSGWSMISLPVIPCNASVSSLFSETKTVYGYEKDAGYLRVAENEELEGKKGYWIFLDQNQNYTFTGKPMLSYNKTICIDGWEMIGGCTYSAKASTNGCNIGVIYDYLQGTGYQRVPGSQELKPGKGYWTLFRDFTFLRIPRIPRIPDADFEELLHVLDFPIVTSCIVPNLQEKITFIRLSIDGQVSLVQNIILTCDEMTSEQRDAYFDFANKSKIKIAQARIFDPDNPRNQNRSLFDPNNFDPIRKNFIFTYYYGLNNREIDSDYDTRFTEFSYKESRYSFLPYMPLKPGETTIRTFMRLKRNQKLTLKEGLYFFESLILEENSILNTDGAVQLYVKKLELEKNAKLMGGTSINPDDASPNDLIILSKCWPGSGCDIDDDWVKIGSTAKVCGHIFAPDLKVILCKGSMGRDTRVYGSILTYQLVTTNCDPTDRSYGPIWIMYTENLGCTFELNVSK